jgi:MIP family channel proteins
VDQTTRAAVAEFIATFALVFIGAGAVILNASGQLDLTGVALANGFVLFIMISVIGHVSGGHVNPAVTLGLWTTGRVPTRRAGIFVVAQLLGAVAGALLLKFVIPTTWFAAGRGGIPAVDPIITAGKAIVIEAAATFLLLFAFFGTMVDRRGPWSTTAGLTIGLVVAFGIMVFGPLTGAAMNPARWFGPAVATGDWANWYVWIVGPLAGGVIGGSVYWACFLRGEGEATEP